MRKNQCKFQDAAFLLSTFKSALILAKKVGTSFLYINKYVTTDYLILTYLKKCVNNYLLNKKNSKSNTFLSVLTYLWTVSKVKGQGWPFNEDRGKQTVDLSFLFGVYVKIQSARRNCLKGQKISNFDIIKRPHSYL